MKHLIITLAIVAGACHQIDYDDPIVDSLDEPVETDDTQLYWVVAMRADIVRWKVETADYLPDPWAALYRLGDVVATTASCDMETYKPAWEDHLAARSVDAWVDDAWTIVLYDYELEPSGDNWLGSCVLDVAPSAVEHELVYTLDNCTGAVESITISFELYDGDIDTIAERNPNC